MCECCGPQISTRYRQLIAYAKITDIGDNPPRPALLVSRGIRHPLGETASNHRARGRIATLNRSGQSGQWH